MSAGAIRAAVAAEKRRVRTPPEVAELLAEGRRAHAEMVQEARDAAALVRVQAHIQHRMSQIARTVSPAVRARLLGNLADWMVRPDNQEILRRAAALPPRAFVRREIEVPAWAQDYAGLYQAQARAAGELSAAAMVRRLKREAHDAAP